MAPADVFVFFDLGETLVDLGSLVKCIASRLQYEFPSVEAAAGEIAHTWIRRTSDSLPRKEGLPFVREIEVASHVLTDLLVARSVRISAEDAEAVLRRSWNDFEEAVTFCPGVTEAWLEEIGGLATGLGIVTDGDAVNVDRLVNRLRLSDHFDVVVTSESVRAYKPRRPIYMAALQALRADPGWSFFVSDTALDLSGAAAVGMRTVFLPRRLLSRPTDLPAGAIVLKHPSDLCDALREFVATKGV